MLVSSIVELVDQFVPQLFVIWFGVVVFGAHPMGNEFDEVSLVV